MSEVSPAEHQLIQHCCARILFDGAPCDIPEHAAIACKGCIPYVHSDGSWEHEPGCREAP